MTNKNKTIVMYARYEAVRNDAGKVVDALCLDVNKRFCEFYNEKEPVGKMRSKMLYASNPLVCSTMQKVLSTGKSEILEYEEDGLGCVDVIVESAGDGKSCYVYTIDVELLKQNSIMNKVALRKFSVAADLYGLAIWQWDIQKHKIYADSVLTDLTGDEDVDLKRDQLKWDEFDRLDYVYEEDRDVVMNALYSLRDGINKTVHFDFRIIHNGELHNVEVRAIVDRFDENGKALTVMAVTRMTDASVFDMPHY